MTPGQMSEQEQVALLELFAACSTVFDEEPYTSEKAMAMSLRRIQRPTQRARDVFLSAPIIGRGA